ncbi:hypothetical protein HBA54_03205 [Pelagibius litoralis]|uniref:Terminase-like family protein n=1 Tax=Pelagibius litoralis TaxID=374515 RepID=A0A967C3I5_9PROT|nr:hypothetical protein [Pelagibius litoralis]NIA67590.1 hypothetical protein [Pelagibius litoralis]
MAIIPLDMTGSPCVYDYIYSDAFVTGIIGPLGSGKSFGSCAKVMRHASEQRKSDNGYRRSRVGVIRNTYGELKSTTIKTWNECFKGKKLPPVKIGAAPIQQHIIIHPTDHAPGLDLEVLFLALDKEDDIGKLKSLDLSFAWLNEASELPRGIIDMVTGRVGRFPGKDEGWATWAGVFWDTNAADERAWTEEADEGAAPEIRVTLPDGSEFVADWQVIRQPPAMLEVGTDFQITEPGHHRMGEQLQQNECIQAAGRYWAPNDKPDVHGEGAAENLNNLRPGYYHQQVSKKLLPWLRRYAQAKRIYLVPGKPWVPEFSQTTMVRPLSYDPNLDLLVGIDAGGGTLNPAAVWAQVGMLGDWRILKELVIADIGLDAFCDAVLREHAKDFQNAPIRAVYVDPAARQRDQIYKVVVGDHMRSKGLPVQYAPSNDPDVRRNALASPMGRLVPLPNGESIPGFLVDPSCKWLIGGLAGRWCRRKLKTSGENYADRPEKNEWSHPGDACSYVTSGGGEYRTLKHGAAPGQNPNSMTARARRGESLQIQFDHSGLFD